jgi:hypothetical protein
MKKFLQQFPSVALRFSLVVSVSMGLVGCGGSPTPKTAQAKVSGTITYDGSPIPLDSSVVFSCMDPSATAAGKVDSLGKYSLTGGDPSLGIPVGRYKVMIRPAIPPAPVMGTPEYSATMSGKVKPAAAPKEIPTKFHALDTSGLVLEVKAGDNTFDFDLLKLSQ